MNDTGYPLTTTSDVSKASDWQRLRATSISHPTLRAYFDNLVRLIDRAGEGVPVIVTVFDPFTTAADNRDGPLASAVGRAFEVAARLGSRP